MSSSKHRKTPNGAVSVRDNNVDRALRVLKKKLQREGVFREMKARKYFQSKGEKDREARAKSASRAFKTAAKKFASENMIPVAEAKAHLKRNGRSPR